MPFQKMPDDTLASLSILRYWPLLPTPCGQISLCCIFRPLYFKTGKTYKADIHQSNSKNSKDFINNIHTHFQFSNGPGWPLKAICLKPVHFLAFFVFLGPLYLKMEMLHNPVSHQFARALCREEENYLEILPDFCNSQIWACESRKLCQNHEHLAFFLIFRPCVSHKSWIKKRMDM